MITHICIIRGINVWWHNKITMESLAHVFIELEFSEVQTYIQSGNVLFSTIQTDSDRLTDMITHAINRMFQLDVVVQVKTVDQRKQIISQCPYSKARPEGSPKGSNALGVDVSNLYITFLWSKPVKKATPEIVAACTQWEQFSIVDQQVYLLCPNWYGTTKLSNAFLEKKLKTNATTRNWNTVCKIGEIIQKKNPGN